MFVEAPSFPLALSYGATGGPVYSTDLVQRSSGLEQRNANWRQPRCQWDVGSQHRTQAEVDELVQFFHAVAKGMENVWRFRDFTDDAFDNPIGTGDGTTTTFQLVKVYTYGAQSSTRLIVKPIAGSLHLYVAGVAREDYTPDFTTGLMTFATPPGAGDVVSASGNFEVPTRFNQNVLPITRVALHAYAVERVELVEVRWHDEALG
jgi:uncharacterized protein (TIGR02217 family)